jgi:hypothetical protein
VIPSGGGESGKHPLVNWKGYQENPPTEEQFHKWQEELRPSLWGIVTGKVSGLVVLDADTPEAVAILEADGIQPHILTPNGGHNYFKHPGREIKNAVKKVKGIDWRGDGGFVNVIGKNPVTGGEYKIVTLPTPDTIYPWGELPKVILEAINTNGSKPSDEIEKQPDTLIPYGERNDYLFRRTCGYRAKGDSKPTMRRKIEVDYDLNCVHDPEITSRELDDLVDSACKYQAGLPPSIKATQTETLNVTLKHMIDIQPAKVRWLWPPYIPVGKLTLLEGDPGTGKSHVCLAIGTAVSRGIGIGEQAALIHGRVLIASAEDGLEDTIRPRLDKMGANISNIDVIDGLFTLDAAGIALLEHFIAETLPALVILDPLVAYLSGEVDIHKANMVRQVTAHLARLADRYTTAMLCVRHLTKGGSTKAIYRGLGSIDFTASARSVLLTGFDPDDPLSRGFCHIKSNLAKEGEPVGFQITDEGFFWTETCSLTVEQIMSPDASGSLQDAVTFLNDLLADGPMDASEVLKEADNRDIKRATLYRAKAAAGVKSVRCGEAGKKGGGKFTWELGAAGEK